MGEAARRFLLRTTTPGERFDLGLELSEAMVESVLSRHPLPPGLSEEEKIRRRFRILREAGR